MKQVLNRLGFGYHYFFRNEKVASYPLDVNIELTNLCNLSCTMCPRTNDVPRKIGRMDFTTFKKIIDELSGRTEFALLNGAGEPLLHPELFRFIEYATSKKVKTLFSTNGILLDENHRKLILSSSLSYLFLNINAHSRSTYLSIMGKDYYPLVKENVENLLAVKKKRGGGPRVIAQLIPMKKNQNEKQAFEKYWKEKGVDEVSLKPFRNFGGTIPPLADLEKKRERRPPCYLLWKEIAFYYDGTATACCMDFREKLVLGNIHRLPFSEIWNNEKMQKLRHQHLNGHQELVTLCKNCNQPPLPPLSAAGLSVLSSDLKNRLIPLFYRMGLG